MDSILIDYLKSGKAWVLIGSGPSNEMGYPSWGELAAAAAQEAKIVGRGENLRGLESAERKKDYPKVFNEAKDLLGGPRLLQTLEAKLKPSGSGEVYKLMARWPVPVYLTTNYDDEIQKQLAALGEAYIPYSNSEDHFAYLVPDFSGGIFKLHGDLRSEKGLILTTSQYRAIEEHQDWSYWRTKMTSIFQMNRVVVVGHSLLDTLYRTRT